MSGIPQKANRLKLLPNLLTEQMKSCPTPNLESNLKAFVSCSLEQSYSNKDIDANLQILNCAWEAQKLLWKLRDSCTQEPSSAKG